MTDIEKAYREVFTSGAGQEVLAHILSELDFFNTEVTTPEEVARANAARRILEHMGIWVAENAITITQAILAIPPLEVSGDIEREDSNGE